MKKIKLKNIHKLTNFKIEVTPKLSRKIQNKLFEHGYSWTSNPSVLMHTDAKYLFFDKNSSSESELCCSNDDICFNTAEEEEIKIKIKSKNDKFKTLLSLDNYKLETANFSKGLYNFFIDNDYNHTYLNHNNHRYLFVRGKVITWSDDYNTFNDSTLTKVTPQKRPKVKKVKLKNLISYKNFKMRINEDNYEDLVEFFALNRYNNAVYRDFAYIHVEDNVITYTNSASTFDSWQFVPEIKIKNSCIINVTLEIKA